MTPTNDLPRGCWYSLDERRPPDGEEVLFVLELPDGAEVVTGTLRSVPRIKQSIAVRWMRIPHPSAA
ncbi:MAG TPA: hypothetical protein VFU27_02370 [Terriglobales bacterium]|nr:hypothetical protein [Terriglobales bacterium]